MTNDPKQSKSQLDDENLEEVSGGIPLFLGQQQTIVYGGKNQELVNGQQSTGIGVKNTGEV